MHEQVLDCLRNVKHQHFLILWVPQSGRLVIEVPDRDSDIHEAADLQHVPPTSQIRQHQLPKGSAAIKAKHVYNKFSLLSAGEGSAG